MSSRVRLVVIPLVLFVGVSGVVYGLAKAHPAKPEVKVAAGAAGKLKVGDQYRGETVFQESCSGCHGDGGSGGSGPQLAGTGIPLIAAKAQIDNGGGTMPAGIVSGSQEEDLLAYLQTIMPASR